MLPSFIHYKTYPLWFKSWHSLYARSKHYRCKLRHHFSPSLLVRECTLWYNNRGSELWTTSADYMSNCIGNGGMQIFIFCALYWNAIRYSRKGIAWELEMTYTVFVLCSDRYHIGFKFGSLGQVEEMTIRYYCEFTLGSAKLSCFIHCNKKTFVRNLYILLLNMF